MNNTEPEDRDSLRGIPIPGTPFDYDEVDRRISGVCVCERDKDFNNAADMLATVCSWLATGKDLRSIGRRAVTLAFCLNPRVFNRVSSFVDLSRKFGGTKASYSKRATEIYRLSRGVFVANGMQDWRKRRTSQIVAIKAHGKR